MESENKKRMQKYYKLWVTSWVQKIEKSDEKGDSKVIYQGAKVLIRTTAQASRYPIEHYETDKSKNENKT